MRRATLILSFAVGLAACDPEPFACRGDGNGTLPSAVEVCAHLREIGCFVDQDPHTAGFDDPSCEAGYEDVRAQVPPEEMVRIARCYLAAESCGQVEGCNRRCGPEGGTISFDAGDGILEDGGASDASASGDAGQGDGGGPADASLPEDASSPMDASLPEDASLHEDAAIPPDAGRPDAGRDAGSFDAAAGDAGSDAGGDAGGPTGDGGSGDGGAAG